MAGKQARGNVGQRGQAISRSADQPISHSQPSIAQTTA
jgi:hypothetical protein